MRVGGGALCGAWWRREWWRRAEAPCNHAESGGAQPLVASCGTVQLWREWWWWRRRQQSRRSVIGEQTPYEALPWPLVEQMGSQPKVDDAWTAPPPRPYCSRFRAVPRS